MSKTTVASTGIDLSDTFAFTGTVSGTPSDIELITTTHITSASVNTCDFTSFSTDFNHLIIKIADFQPSGNNGQLIVRMQTTGSSGFSSESNAYYSTRTRVYGNASSYTTNQSGFQGTYGVASFGIKSSGNGYATVSSHMDLYFSNIHSTTRKKTYYGVFWGGGDFGSASHQLCNSTYVGTGDTAALTGIRFQSSSGDLIGRFSLYGVRT